MKNRTPATVACLALLLAASACSSSETHESHATATTTTTASPAATASGSSSPAAMDHSGHTTTALPTNIPLAKTPRYRIGSAVTVLADHMPGMKGAKGSVAAAYDTTTYAVTYTPTDGSAVVKDHKWVVQQELQGAGTAPLKVGDAVTLTADHMAGMKGAKGTVTQVVTTPVYAVNYMPTDGSTMVMNHLWVTQDELAAA